MVQMFGRHSRPRGRRTGGTLACLLLCCLTACTRATGVGDSFDPAAGPVLRALQVADPGVFEAVIRNVSRTGDVTDDTVRLQVELRRQVVPAFIARASDDAVRDYVRVTIAELKELRDASYFRCYTYLYGDPQDDEARYRLEATLSPATRAAGLEVMARLVESAGSSHAPVDDTEAWRVLDNVVMPALPAWLGERKMVLRDPQSRDIDRVATCEVSLAVYEAAVDLPSPDGLVVLRFMLSRAAALP